MNDLTVAILAGGLGIRLRSRVADRPKVLAEVHGRPFLSYLLDQLDNACLKDVVLCTGYMGEQVQTQFGSAYKGLNIAYSQEIKPLGTAGALRLALPLCHSDFILVLNGDSFCDVDLKGFISWCHTTSSEFALVLAKVLDSARYGRVNLNLDNTILGFEEKKKNEAAEGPNWINAGIYYLKRDLLLEIQTDKVVSLERDIFPGLISRGLRGFPSQGKFLDIGIPEAYAQATQFFSLDTNS